MKNISGLILLTAILLVGCAEDKRRYEIIEYEDDDVGYDIKGSNSVEVEAVIFDTYTGDLRFVSLNMTNHNASSPDSIYTLGYEYDYSSEEFKIERIGKGN